MAPAEQRDNWQKPYSTAMLISSVSIAIAKYSLAVVSSSVEERVGRPIRIGIFQPTGTEIDHRHANHVGKRLDTAMNTRLIDYGPGHDQRIMSPGTRKAVLREILEGIAPLCIRELLGRDADQGTICERISVLPDSTKAFAT